MEPIRTHPLDPARSTQGVALIIVLLLLAVMSALASGLVVNGHVDIAMATNETYYAGARAAAEAGMNRAVEAVMRNTTPDLLAIAIADDGKIASLFPEAAPNGRYPLGTTGQYSYMIQVLDDDDPALYPNLTLAQRTAMGEDGSAYTNINERLILRSTGFGPSGTTVTVSRILTHVDKNWLLESRASTFFRLALLVYGDLEITGRFGVDSDEDGIPGSVHVNGNLDVQALHTADPHSRFDHGTADYTLDVAGDVTASGTRTVSDPNWRAGGGGPEAPVASPFDVDANSYRDQATHVLTADGVIVPQCNVSQCGWTFARGTNTWSHQGGGATDPGKPGRIYFVEGVNTKTRINGGGVRGQTESALKMSVFAQGSIELSGNPYLRHAPGANGLILVANGDLTVAIDNNRLADDDSNTTTGVILVRGQIATSGRFHPHGQIIVQNESGAGTDIDRNTIGGVVWLTKLGQLSMEGVTRTAENSGEYVNEVTGWMESQ